MLVEVLDKFPVWLLEGALAGLVLSVVVAGLFYVAVRQFPKPEETEPRSSGDGRRRAEIRSYLDAIEEPYAENRGVRGHTVAFYLPDRDIAITFDARAYYGLDGTDTEAVLVEHELPGVALESRLPFETPTRDLEDDEASEVEPDEAAFAVLGLPAGASVEEVRQAYRRKVKEVHPDHGGDKEQFEQVQEAYATARERAS